MATKREIDDVIKTLIAEGVGEGTEGMRRIAETILNRAEQRGISPEEVVRQRAQYTGYSNPGPAAVRAQSDPSAISAAQAAWQLAQGPDDPTGGANHYFNPSIVRPSWAQSMTPTGEYGGHAFYTDRAVPPRNIPPSIASMSPTAAAVRQMTSPSGGNGALQSALNQVATRERNRVAPQLPPVRSVQTVATIPSTSSLTAPGAINASIGGLSQDGALAAALARRSPFGDDPGFAADGTVVATIPSRPSASLYAGGGLDRSAFNGDPGIMADGPVVASFSTAAPTTRSVPTTRVGNSSNNIAQARNEQGIQRSAVPPVVRPVASPAPSIRTSADIASLYAQGGPTRPVVVPRVDSIGSMPTFRGLQDMAGARFDMNAADRLPQGTTGIQAGYGTMAPQRVAQIGLPSLAPPMITPRPNPVGVGTQLSVNRPSQAPARTAPVPFNRPSFGGILAPQMAQPSRSPLRILVQGANAIRPTAPVPQTRPVAQQSLYFSSPTEFGQMAVSQSGDTSSGNQLEAAQARASGAGGRIRRY